MKALLVVPARLGSTRFPRKVLAPLGGKPLVQWCWQAARAAGMGEVLVATESQEVAQAVRSFGGEAVLTSPSCRSGSDRVHEAAKGRREELIVNVQGDQPFLDPEAIRSTLLLLEREPSLDIATAVSPLTERSKLEDANVVKVAMTEAGRCLYFSRAPIPFERSPGALRWEHVGLYAFRRAALGRFVALPPSPLELAESLEQLRALEAGMTISAAVVSRSPLAVDVPRDLERAQSMLAGRER